MKKRQDEMQTIGGGLCETIFASPNPIKGRLLYKYLMENTVFARILLATRIEKLLNFWQKYAHIWHREDRIYATPMRRVLKG